MSGFDAAWLALREPADHAARDPALAAALGAHFADRAAVSIVDLGCGTGSNLRALAARLPARQAWRLVDHDPALLAVARERLAAWADDAREEGDDLLLAREGRAIRVSFREADLPTDLDAVLGEAPDLVTAAALFDLASEAWIGRFAAAAAARRAAVYAVLTYDGRSDWRPPHPADAAIQAAFDAHQRGDKGFGLAAGPEGGARLALALARAGYGVREADSPWRLEPGGLLTALVEGIAEAVEASGRVDRATLSAWTASRRSAEAGTIGHRDVLGLP